MTLREFLSVVLRRWNLVLGCVLAGVVAALIVSSVEQPTYASTTRLFVSTPQTDSAQAYEGSLLSAQRVSSYIGLVNSREFATSIITGLRLPMSPSQLSNKVSATAAPGTVILQITVKDPSPRRAQMIAQAAGEQLRRMVAALETPPGKTRAPIKVTMIDPAFEPSSPVSPQRSRNVAVGLVVGALLGLAAAVTRDALDSTVREDDHVAGYHIPVLGRLPMDLSASEHAGAAPLHSDGPLAEAFRVLRANLQFADGHSSMRLIAVTSPAAQEGKTFTATRLALALAEAGNRTLLLEGDLRAPGVASNLQLGNHIGLTSVLLEEAFLMDALQRVGPNELDVLTSGPPAPSPPELIQSKGMDQLLQEVRAMYDVIVMDTPPLLSAADASILSRQSDGCLLVVRWGKTSKDQLRQAVERLDAVARRPLGIVMNAIPASTGFHRVLPALGGKRGRETHTQAADGRPRYTTADPSNHMAISRREGD